MTPTKEQVVLDKPRRFKRHHFKDNERLFVKITDTVTGESEEFAIWAYKAQQVWMWEQGERS